MKNENQIVKGLTTYANIVGTKSRKDIVYILTNYDTTHEQDIYRVNVVRELGFAPYVMVYRKNTAPPITRYLQRWCNNKFIYRSCAWEDYCPNATGKSIKEMFYT